MAMLLVFIFFSRNLSRAEYGNYQNFWVSLYLLSAVATLGIPAFILTYSPPFIKSMLQKMTQSSYLKVFSWIFIVSVVFAYVIHINVHIPWYIALCFLVVFSLNTISEAFLIVFKRFGFLLLLNGLYTLLFLLVHYGFLIGVYDLQKLFLFLLFFRGFRLVVVALVARMNIKRIRGDFDKQYTVADILSLWKHIGIYDVSSRFITWVDKFVVSIIFTASVSAIYFNATYDIPFLPVMLGAVGGAALMQLSVTSKEQNDNAAIVIANFTSRLLSSIVFPLFFFLYVFRHELFTVVLTAKYTESVPIFAVTVFIVPLRAYNFTTILQNRHKGRIMNTGVLLDAVIAFGLMYPLYQFYGLLGIALSFVVSTYAQGAYYLYNTGKVLNVSMINLVPLKNWIGKIIVFSLVFITTHYIAKGRLNDTYVLLLGSMIMVVAILVTLIIELRKPAEEYGATVS